MIKIGRLLVVISTLIVSFQLVVLLVSHDLGAIFSMRIYLALTTILLYFLGFVMLIVVKGETGKKIAEKLSGFIGLTIFLIGLFLKYYHWPLSSIMIVIAVSMLAIIFAPLYFRRKYLKWKLYTRSSRDAFLLCLFDFLGIFIVLVAAMFKLMHLPGAGNLAIMGVLAVSISIFAWNQKFKKEVVYRKKAEDKLREQKNEIEDKNEELKQQSEELQSQNEEIIAQRDQIEKHHTAIKDSIFYAKRIQTAVLPRKEYIEQILPENFILFRPKDIVSGDFYWVKQIGEKIIIIAADCTGHGVPGSIMSMLGVSFITEIVRKQQLFQADLILNELRVQIKQALRQTSEKDELFDGMDMALCILDLKNNVLEFAGAVNPLYLVQNGELKVVKADRMPIGYYPKEVSEFTKHEIQLSQGDSFYIFSDGYVDQFGGKKGFKYKAVNFQNLLLKNHQKPMAVQKESLEQELNSWMNGYEQTDDILVMGVRV